MNARPKFTYIRSKPLMEAYRKIPCQSCGRDDGTVVGAHSNQSEHGKGRSIKASDDYCASLCVRCHAQVDSSYSLSKYERETMWAAARYRTATELIRRNLWPPNIPKPDLSEFVI